MIKSTMARVPGLYLLLLLLLNLLQVYVLGEYFLQVRIHSYTNPSSSCALCNQIACCDPSNGPPGPPAGPPGPSCTGSSLCDTFFTYCVQPLNLTTRCIPQAISATAWNGGPTASFSLQPKVLGLPNPLLLPGVSRQWEGATLYVAAIDNDMDVPQDLPNDLIDDFGVNLLNTVTFITSETPPIIIDGIFSVAQITLSFRVVCAPDFGGERCGEVIDNCLDPFGNCSGRGRCIDGVQSFTCNCQPGFTGQYCEVNTNECANVDCGEYGDCVDGIDNFTCVCQSGYTGRLCEMNIDDCVNVNCTNGQCRDGVNNFTCECDVGFVGEYCTTNIDDCANVDCSGRGTCVDGANSFTCDCLPGYNGRLCESNIDNCLGVNCTGNRRCLDGIDSYECVCNEDYSGTECNLRISHLTTSVIIGPAVGVLITILVISCLVVAAITAVKRHHKKGSSQEQNDNTSPFIGQRRASKENVYAVLNRPGIVIQRATPSDNDPIYWNPDVNAAPLSYSREVSNDSMKTSMSKHGDLEDSLYANPLYDANTSQAHTGTSIELQAVGQPGASDGGNDAIYDYAAVV